MVDDDAGAALRALSRWASTTANCTLGNWNWLGTDDQGRDVVARLIYGFRISVLFGLTLTHHLVGRSASSPAAVQGYFGGWIDLGFQRFIEIWTSIPALYLLLIISSVIAPSFFVLLGILLLFSWVSLVGVVRAEFLRGRNFEYVKRGAGARRLQPHHHVPPPPAQRDGGDADLPAVHPQRLDHDADLARLPRLRPAAGLAVARRAAGAGQGQLHAPWLGLTGFFVISIMLSLLIFVGEAVRDAFDPRKTFTVGTPARWHRHPGTDAPLRRCPRSLGARSRAGTRRAVDRRQGVLRIKGRDGGAGRRIRLGQVGDGAVDPAAPAVPGRLHPPGEILFKGKDLLDASGKRAARGARQRHRHRSSRSR